MYCCASSDTNNRLLQIIADYRQGHKTMGERNIGCESYKNAMPRKTNYPATHATDQEIVQGGKIQRCNCRISNVINQEKKMVEFTKERG